MDKYRKYIKEREDLNLYEDEKGFFTYKEDRGTFLVSELFVLPEFRTNGVGNEYARKIEELAKEHGCKTIVCTTCIDANNWEQSHKYIKSNGYHEVLVEGTMVYYKKEL